MTYGIIIHYGLYSYYGYDNVKSAMKRKIQNGSEWYYGRLIDNNKFRPISGSDFTKQYHFAKHNNINYFDNIDKITNDENKIKNWIRIAKQNKATYIILTSKHHDGVCLWNTNTDSKKSHLNLLEIFANECESENIDFGFYYSWFEFGKPFTLKYFEDYCVKQLNEIIEFGPKYLWFDGDWMITQKKIITEIKQNIIPNIKSKGIIINDRIGVKDNDYSLCDYRVFEDRFIPNKKLNIKWQHINTIGYSWGFNKEQKEDDYKNGIEIYNLYKKVIELEGDFLINLGPDIDGNIIDKELEAIKYLSTKI